MLTTLLLSMAVHIVHVYSLSTVGLSTITPLCLLATYHGDGWGGDRGGGEGGRGEGKISVEFKVGGSLSKPTIVYLGQQQTLEITRHRAA